MPSINLPDTSATLSLGRRLASTLRAGDVVALSGPLGAGKTTLARGVLQGLGYEGEVASPSFPIVLAYALPEVRLPLWHVDLYRIEDPAELEELGLAEARGEAIMLIEWPERLPALWPETLHLTLADAPEGGRALTASVPPAWGGRWPPR